MSKIENIALAFGDLFQKRRDLAAELTALDSDWRMTSTGDLYAANQEKPVGRIERDADDTKWLGQVIAYSEEHDTNTWQTQVETSDFLHAMKAVWYCRHFAKRDSHLF
jgi:hypothetical protein